MKEVLFKPSQLSYADRLNIVEKTQFHTYYNAYIFPLAFIFIGKLVDAFIC